MFPQVISNPVSGSVSQKKATEKVKIVPVTTEKRSEAKIGSTVKPNVSVNATSSEQKKDVSQQKEAAKNLTIATKKSDSWLRIMFRRLFSF